MNKTHTAVTGERKAAREEPEDKSVYVRHYSTDEQTKADWQDFDPELKTPEGREAYWRNRPNKKRGRPYKNPNLIPQGVADHIRKLEQQRDELLAAAKAYGTMPDNQWRENLLLPAIANAERNI